MRSSPGSVSPHPNRPRGLPIRPAVKSIAHARAPAHRTEELGPLIFAYFGPEPAALLPRYDFLVGEGIHYVTIQGFQNCHWLQCVENGIDPVLGVAGRAPELA